MAKKPIPKKRLKSIWDQVPINYYEDGERKNIGQKLWHSHKRRIFRQIFSKIESKFKNNRSITILDLGSADGHLTGWLADEWKNSTVWGIDVVPKLIKAAQKKYPQAKFKIGDGHAIPFPDKTFDLVVCSEVLEHVVDPVIVITEIKRVLKKGGVLVIELDTGNWLFSFLWFFWTRFGAGKVWVGAHLHQFDPRTLTKTVKKGGLYVSKKIVHHLGMATTVIGIRK